MQNRIIQIILKKHNHNIYGALSYLKIFNLSLDSLPLKFYTSLTIKNCLCVVALCDKFVNLDINKFMKFRLNYIGRKYENYL